MATITCLTRLAESLACLISPGQCEGCAKYHLSSVGSIAAGQLPTLELYVTLMRTLEENEYVIERAVDGMDLSVGAYFK